jgi:hypothetical protein
MSWLHQILKQATDNIINRSMNDANGFRISARDDLKDDGPSCSSVDISQGNTRFFRITVKSFPRAQFAQTNSLPPTYVYFKLFKWEPAVHDYLKASQTNMNIHEYYEFLQARETIDKILKTMLLEPAATEAFPFPPPAYDGEMEAAVVGGEVAPELPME